MYNCRGSGDDQTLIKVNPCTALQRSRQDRIWLSRGARKLVQSDTVPEVRSNHAGRVLSQCHAKIRRRFCSAVVMRLYCIHVQRLDGFNLHPSETRAAAVVPSKLGPFASPRTAVAKPAHRRLRAIQTSSRTQSH